MIPDPKNWWKDPIDTDSIWHKMLLDSDELKKNGKLRKKKYIVAVSKILTSEIEIMAINETEATKKAYDIPDRSIKWEEKDIDVDYVKENK